jgi:hypothetical protein
MINRLDNRTMTTFLSLCSSKIGIAGGIGCHYGLYSKVQVKVEVPTSQPAGIDILTARGCHMKHMLRLGFY